MAEPVRQAPAPQTGRRAGAMRVSEGPSPFPLIGSYGFLSDCETTALVAPIFTQAATAAPNDVVVGGKSIGQDPDANVRLQMRRDAGSEGGF